MSLPGRAKAIAVEQLAETLPRRWAHVQAVARKAEAVGSVLMEPREAVHLVSAAWLHDIGYAPALVSTGFHALDGARWLRRHGFDERVAALVAYHSCAYLEASER